MEHDQTSSEKAKAVLEEDLRKLADLDQEIQKAAKDLEHRRIHGETDLGMVEEAQVATPDKESGAV